MPTPNIPLSLLDTIQQVENTVTQATETVLEFGDSQPYILTQELRRARKQIDTILFTLITDEHKRRA